MLHVISYQHNAQQGDIVKVRVNLKMEHVADWDAIRSKVETWANEQGFIVNTIQPVVAYVQGERASFVKGKKKSDLEYLNSFASRTGIDERTLQVGKDIIDLI